MSAEVHGYIRVDANHGPRTPELPPTSHRTCQPLRHRSEIRPPLAAQAPWLHLLAVLVMALGIGVNTAVFVAVNTVLLRPVPPPGLASSANVSQYLAPVNGRFCVGNNFSAGFWANYATAFHNCVFREGADGAARRLA